MLALVLSGGGIYGAAHVGVVSALENMGIVPDLVVGTSAGSLVGGVWAAGHGAETLTRMTCDLTAKDVPVDWRTLLRAIWRPGRWPDQVMSLEPLLKKAENLVGRFSVRNTPRPCYITASSLTTRRVVVFGPPLNIDPASAEALKIDSWPADVPLLTAMTASTAVPGLFRPVFLDGHWLVDGGVMDDYPLDVAVFAGATRVIGVYIDDRGSPVPGDSRRPPHIVAAAGASLNLLLNDSTRVRRHLVAERFHVPRVEIPIPVTGMGLTDFRQVPALIARGIAETEARAEALKRLAAA
jgi:NTE family protein